MTQQQCLSTPSHYTRYGVCYVGSSVTIPIHGITVGGATGVPEPSTLPLALLAAAIYFGISKVRHARGD